MSQFDLQYSAARRAVIAKDFERLNGMQRQAVLKTEGPLLLLAGAGSGKTTVLINRIINLLRYGAGSDCPAAPVWAGEEELRLLKSADAGELQLSEEEKERLCAVQPPRPWEIIAITFTNKAAGELKSRLEAACGSDGSEIWACTFHSACARILRRDITRLGYGASFAIYDEDDKKRLISSIIKELGYDEKRIDPRAVGSRISGAKDALVGPEEFASSGGDYYHSVVAQVYQVYERRLLAANALDFDDMIFKTVQLLRDFPEVREHYQRRFKYVLVDEYQDTNHAQYVLCSLLAGGYGNLCVVGDDDQSIYKFRGATIRNILEFEESFPGAGTIRLEQNYRSTGNILAVANRVISQNLQRKGKALWTDKPDGEKVQLFVGETQDEEAYYIVKQIYDQYSKGEKLNNFTVLYRNHALSNNIEAAFKRSRIPYRIVAGLRFFDRAEVKDMLAYLWVIHNPADSVRLRRVINQPARKIGAKTVDALADISEKHGISMFQAAKNAERHPELMRNATALLSFTELIESLSALREQAPLIELYELLLERSGYLDMLRSQNGEEAVGKIENVMELKSTISEYAARAEAPTLGGFLEEISLLTDVDGYDPEADAVSMMTVHSAKGLEFDTVFICGAEEGLFPSYRSMENPEELEEERRLCYVAMTRAKKSLHVTASRRRMLYGQTSYAKPSRFIDEIPMGNAEWHCPAAPAHKPKRETVPASAKYVRNVASGISVTAEKPPADFNFRPGQRVRHQSFGDGSVTAATPMGGDFLLEIRFDSVGKKLMMAKTAAQFMNKI